MEVSVDQLLIGINAYNDGENLIARTNMLSAALMGATAFQKGLGAIHSVSHPIGAIYNTHHGTTNAVVMENVVKFNKEKIVEKVDQICDFLSISGGFNGFTNFIHEFCNNLEIPKRLTDLGVKENQLQLISEMAVVDPTSSGNPIKLTTKNTLELLKRSFSTI